MKYCERIYSESELKLIEEIFDMYMKQIYDEDLEKLNGELRRYKSIVYLCEKVKDCDKE